MYVHFSVLFVDLGTFVFVGLLRFSALLNEYLCSVLRTNHVESSHSNEHGVATYCDIAAVVSPEGGAGASSR